MLFWPLVLNYKRKYDSDSAFSCDLRHQQCCYIVTLLRCIPSRMFLDFARNVKKILVALVTAATKGTLFSSSISPSSLLPSSACSSIYRAVVVNVEKVKEWLWCLEKMECYWWFCMCQNVRGSFILMQLRSCQIVAVAVNA